MADVVLRDVVKRFGEVEVVHSINLAIAHNEFVVLVGPSGCGKSTLLRMIAGLEDISAGEIVIDGRVVNELAPKNRDIAMVFQDYALYPHLDAFRNISFGLEMRRLPKAEIRERVLRAARILDIGELLDRKPGQLSGGQRQRVAMGRAIVRDPKVFLFDEPLSNLDAKLRSDMRTEIKKLHQQVGTTVVYVTHDQIEAMTLAQRIVVLRSGYVEQIGTPEEIYNRPANLFVAGFIGAPRMNQIACHTDGSAAIVADGTSLPLPAELARHLDGTGGRDLILGLRPEAFFLAAEGRAGGPMLEPLIRIVEPLGSDTLVFFALGGAEVVARLPPLPGLQPGERVPLGIDTAKLRFFDPATGKAL